VVKLKKTFLQRIKIAAVVSVILSIIPLILFIFNLHRYMHLFIIAGVYACISTALYVQGIGTGRNNFGPQFFVALGGFTAGLSNLYLYLSPAFTLLTALSSGLIFGLATSLLTIFVGGLYYSLVTIIIPYVFLQLTYIYSGIFGGEEGIKGISPIVSTGRVIIDLTIYAYIIITFLLVYLFVMDRVLKSKYGLAFRAINENERVAMELGVNVNKYKVIIHIVTSAMMSLMGWFIAHYYKTFAGVEYLPLYILLKFYLTIALSGGLYGIIPASFLVIFIEDFLRNIFGQLNYFIFPLVMLILFLVLPTGLLGIISKQKVSEHLPIRFRRTD